MYGPIVELHAIYGRATAIAKTIVGRDGDDPHPRPGPRRRDLRPAHRRRHRCHARRSARHPGVRRRHRPGAVPARRRSRADGGSAGRRRRRADPGLRRPGTVRRGRVLDAGAHPPRDRDGALRRPRPIPATRRTAETRRNGGPTDAWHPAAGCPPPDARSTTTSPGKTAATPPSRTTPVLPRAPHRQTPRQLGVRQIPGSGGAIEWTSPTGRRYIVQPERRVPVFTVDPTATPNPSHPSEPPARTHGAEAVRPRLVSSLRSSRSTSRTRHPSTIGVARSSLRPDRRDSARVRYGRSTTSAPASSTRRCESNSSPTAARMRARSDSPAVMT